MEGRNTVEQMERKRPSSSDDGAIPGKRRALQEVNSVLSHCDPCSSSKLPLKDATEKETDLGGGYGFYLARVRGIKYGSIPAISLREILDGKNGKLVESAQFNYMFELEWLIRQYPEESRSLPLLIVHGHCDGQGDELRYLSKQHSNVSVMTAALPVSYGTHHTKLMLLRYEDGLRLVVHTANMVQADWSFRTQGLWISPKLPPGDGDSVKNFRKDLLEYLGAYKELSETSEKFDHWIDLIKAHDFSSINVWLITSIPGVHKFSKIRCFGHPKLASVLEKYKVDRSWPLVGQFSSIGSLGRSPTWWLTTEWSRSLAGKGARGICLIFPSVDTVRNSLEGYQAGSCLPYSVSVAAKQPWLTQYLHDWHGTLPGISRASPHMKSYLRCSPDGGKVAWFLLTSANLSKAAWGGFDKLKQALTIRSYELGVLFTPEVEDGEEDVLKDFPVPYQLPPNRYKQSDEPWIVDVPHMQPDSNGETWQPICYE